MQLGSVFQHVASAALVVFFACLCGCEKEVSSPASGGVSVKSRAEEAEAMHKLTKGRRLVAAGMRVANRRLDTVRTEAAKALGGKPTPEQIEAELNAHPGKYPDWARAKADLAELEKRRAAEQARVRAGVRAELISRAKAGKKVPPAQK